MTWSYSASSSTLDAVRLYIGDTVADDPLLTDEEIAHFLTAQADPLMAASMACLALSARYARQVNKSLGQLSISAGDRAAAYAALADELRSRAMVGDGLTMLVGGITVSEHTDHNSDTDATKPAYARGQNDLPNNGDKPWSGWHPDG